MNVYGGDEVLNASRGCLLAASTTGVAADQENPTPSNNSSSNSSSSSRESHDPELSVLPDTGGLLDTGGGSLLTVVLGGVMGVAALALAVLAPLYVSDYYLSQRAILLPPHRMP